MKVLVVNIIIESGVRLFISMEKICMSGLWVRNGLLFCLIYFQGILGRDGLPGERGETGGDVSEKIVDVSPSSFPPSPLFPPLCVCVCVCLCVCV